MLTVGGDDRHGVAFPYPPDHFRSTKRRHSRILVMESSNRDCHVKRFCEASNAYAGCRVVFAVDINRRTLGLRGKSLQMWTTHFAEAAVHSIKQNGSAHVPAGTF